MRTPLALFLALLTFPGVQAATAVVPQQRFFASLAMTKMQINSPSAAISGAFLRLTNGKWQHFGEEQIKWVNTVAVSPANPNLIYLGCGNGILRSSDNGLTWRLTTDWHVADVLALRIDPVDPSRLYAASGWGIWRSTDGGNTWLESDRGLPWTGKFTQTLALDSADHRRIIAGTDTGLFVSTDGADTWTRLGTTPKAPIFHVEQSASDPHLWVAGTQGLGVLLSSDNGATWDTATLARANAYGVATDPADGSRIAAAGWAQGVRVSTDAGKTWHDSTHGLPTAQVSALVFDPNHSGRLWASTFEEGTYYSDDLGKTWHLGGLYGAYVNELEFVPARM